MQRRAGGRPKKRNQNLENKKEVNWKFRHTGQLMFQRSSGPRLCIASRLFQPRKSTESSSPSLPWRGVGGVQSQSSPRAERAAGCETKSCVMLGQV